MNIFRNLFLNNRFYWAMGVVITLMMFSFGFPILGAFAKTGFLLLLLLTIADVFLLFNRNIRITVRRSVPPVLSLGDENPIELSVSADTPIRLHGVIVDEIPEQFQQRDFYIPLELGIGKQFNEKYVLRPVSRGLYHFGETHLFISSPIGLAKRKLSFANQEDIPVYPSIIQMKRFELKTFDKKASEYGVKKVRRIGHSYEFEHIKQYARGDDYRSINWKVTSRRAQLMVNQYEDEKSQQVYCVIDKSRVMHMPFGGLSLFDYAVNAALVISNIALGKQDKAGLITFDSSTKSVIKAERSKTQLKKILEALYNEREDLVEASYENLYMTVKHHVSGRSLLFLYTNFESTYALQRALPYLKKLNKHHLLVVVFFENTEITAVTSGIATDLEDIYKQITAEQYVLAKVQMVQQLRQIGISSILTAPEHLTVTSINKYLELKSRGMI